MVSTTAVSPDSSAPAQEHTRIRRKQLPTEWRVHEVGVVTQRQHLPHKGQRLLAQQLRVACEAHAGRGSRHVGV